MQPITDIAQLDLNGSYTYADYLLWQFQERLELIKGHIFKMAAPRVNHQRISRRLTSVFDNFLQGKQCEVFSAPFDVRLYNHKKSHKANKDIYTVVQPDICIICDLSKLDELGCMGAPDLIIEILLPSNSKHEMKTKYELYEEAGVTEYWIADPEHHTLLQFSLNDDHKYQLEKIYADDDSISTPLLPDLHIDLSKIFEQI